MNGYQIIANQYRDVCKDLEGQERKELEDKAKAYQFLADANRPTQLELFNSGAFNNVVKGYVLMSMNELHIDDNEIGAVIQRISELMDEKTSKEAEQYFLLKG